jgi:hypothetical protein
MMTLKRDFEEEEYVKFACGDCDEDKQSCEEKAKKKYHTYDKNQLEKEINETIQKGLDKSIDQFRILCLSENYGDILMWSHYANGHRGFVLQFDTGYVKESFGQCQFSKVFYPPEGSYPSIKDYNEHCKTAMFLIAKSSQWKYEQEWRILKQVETEEEREEEHKLYLFKKGLITGIILGCRMTSKDKQIVSNWRIKYQPEIKLYEAIKNHNCYNIKTIPEIN